MSSLRDVQVAQMYDGRLTVRTRPRRLMFLLFAAAFVTIILFSRNPLLTEPMGASLGFGSSSSPKNSAMEPVVFALIMFSESSATEGAILLKVPSYSNRIKVGVPSNGNNTI